MSVIRVSGNRLYFKVGDREDNVGYLEELESGKCVLWLKDTFGLISKEGMSYYKADEYASMNSAKIKSVEAISVQIWCLIWMRESVKHAAEKQFSSSGESDQNKISTMLGRLPIKDVTALFILIDKVSEFIEKIKNIP